MSIEWLMQGKGRMKVDKEVVDNVATDTTVGMILHRDEQLIRENERLKIHVEELERKLGLNNTPPHAIGAQLADM